MAEIHEIIAGMTSDIRRHINIGNDVTITKLETPSIALTQALGGGFGMGRIVTVYGSKSAGKSSLCLQMIAAAQKKGLACAWIDAEKTFEPEWAQRLGVDTSNLIVSRANDMHLAGDQAVKMISAGLDVLVVDSIGALIQPSFMEGDGFAGMAKTGKIGDFSKGLKQFIRAVNLVNENALVILISQQTTDLSGYHAAQRPEGGNATQFYSSQVVRLRSSNTDNKLISGEISVGDVTYTTPIGREVDWKVEFNKLGPQGETGTYEFYFLGDKVGIDNNTELLTMAMKYGILVRKGSYYKYTRDNGEELSVQGLGAIKQMLDEDEGLFKEILDNVSMAI